MAAVPLVAWGAFAAIVLLGLSLASGAAQGPVGTRVALFGMAGIAFAGAMVLFLPGVLVERKAGLKLRQQHPDQPWRWREDWATGHALGTTRSAVNARWAAALLWNSVAAPFLFAGPVLAREDSGAIAVFAFLVGLIGVDLLFLAIRESLRFSRFGTGVLKLATLPVALGGELRGTIHVRLPSRPSPPVIVTLTCVNRIICGFGRFRRVRNILVWREERTVAPEPISVLATGAEIPVPFDVPVGQPPTRDDPRDALSWLVEVKAALPGIDYREQFEVPVFVTPPCSA